MTNEEIENKYLVYVALARAIAPHIQTLIQGVEENGGYNGLVLCEFPPHLYPEIDHSKMWLQILRQIAEGFQHVVEYFDVPKNERDDSWDEEAVKTSAQLFGKYYLSLWQ